MVKNFIIIGGLVAALFFAFAARAETWVPLYDEKGKFIGYVSPDAPPTDYSQFCAIDDPMCMLDLDGPSNDDESSSAG